MSTRVPLQIHESVTRDVRRLSLVGDLDRASAPALEDRLGRLRARKSPVRLDLSRLQCVDSTGIRLLIQCVADARTKGWRFQIERDLPPQVLGVFTLMHVDGVLECA